MRKQLLLSCFLLLSFCGNAQESTGLYSPLFTDETFDSKSIDLSLPVGIIEAQQSVSSTGAATYSIPIKVAPGTGGMVPSISINYNSQSSNGIVGYGWEIGGISAIAKAHKTYYYDYENSKINDENITGLALNGQKLILAQNGKYFTEITDYSYVQPMGTTNPYSYEWLQLVSKDGKLTNFGETQNSRALSFNGHTIMYYINKVTDQAGNYMTYNYSFILGEKLLTEINYTGNINAGLQPYNKMVFVYDQRQDENTMCIPSYAFNKKNILSRIDLYADGVIYRTYEFKYGVQEGYSFLKEVLEKSATNTQLNSTIFKYGDVNDGCFTTSQQLIGVDYSLCDVNGDGIQDIIVPKSTTNNYTCSVESSIGYNIYKGNSLGSNFQQLGSINLPISEFLASTQSIGTIKKAARNNYIRFISSDFDGNGYDDILRVNTYVSFTNYCYTSENRTNSFTMCYSNGNGTFNNVDYFFSGISGTHYEVKNPQYLQIADFDGDKSPDIFFLLKDLSNGYNNTLLYFNKKLNQVVYASNLATANIFDDADQIEIGDFDGDGDMEFYIFKDYKIDVYDEQISNNSFVQLINIYHYELPIGLQYALTPEGIWNLPTHYKIWLGDFNGDGISDVLFKNKYEIDSVFLNTSFSPIVIPIIKNDLRFQILFGVGNYFNGPSILSGVDIKYSAHRMVQFASQPVVTHDWLLIADYNGDGKSDILHEYRTNTMSGLVSNIEVDYSIGYNNWIYIPYPLSSPFPNDIGVQIGELNGDNRSDVFIGNTQGISKIMYFRPNIKDKLLEKIKNGFGNVTIFEYDALARSNHFSTNHNVYHADIVTRPVPIYVVTRQTANAELSGIAPIINDYHYENSVFHRLGKNFLGFMKLSTIDLSANKISVNEQKFQFYSYNYPNTIDRVLPAGNKDYFFSISPFIALKSEEITINSSITNNALIFENTNRTSIVSDYLSSTNTTSIDNFSNGNIINNTTNIAGVETRTINNAYIQSGNSIYPSKLSFQDASITRQGQNTFSSSISNIYNNGLLSSTTQFYGLPDPITTTYDRDLCGNINIETISCVSSTQSRVKTSIYDSHYRFVTNKINSFGQIESYGNDARWGSVSSFISINQLITNYNYDDFGRLTSINYPNYTVNENVSWNIDPSINAIFKKEIVTPGKPRVIVYFDALGREVRNCTATTEISTTVPPSNIMVPKFSIIDKKYDIRGNVQSTTQPHFNNETNYYTVVNTYDWLNRLETTNDPIHGNIDYDYDYSGGNLKVTAQNAANQASSKTTDATGKVINSTDDGGELTFIYNSQGQITATKLGANVLSTAGYDSYGRKIHFYEANTGMTTYEYTGFGELKKETDQLGNIHNIEYDELGRVIHKSGSEGNIVYSYDNTWSSGAGNIVNISSTPSLQCMNNNDEEFSYDVYGRISSKTEHINGNYFETNYNYDNYDRLIKTTYNNIAGNPIEINNSYNSLGTLMNVNYNGKVLYNSISIDGKNMTTNYSRNNGSLNSTNFYYYGYLTNKKTPSIQDYYLNYDYIRGNITNRTDNIKQLSEGFTYDYLNRLKSATVQYMNPQFPWVATAQTVDYSGSLSNTNGNISKKLDVGDYYYFNKPNAVTHVTNSLGTIPTTVQDITYTPFQKTETVTEGQWQMKYYYGHDFERQISELYNNGGLIRKHYYLNDGHEMFQENGIILNTRHVIYVPGGDGICAIISNYKGAEKIYYPFTDHLGSIQTLVDENNQVVYEQNFDAWGRYRDHHWNLVSPYYCPPMDFNWIRGFTGHEHLPEFALINMNARMYDPVLGRMLSPDKFVSNQYGTQAYNRYSYALNNPLNHIDPDGNFVIAAGLVANAMLTGALLSSAQYVVNSKGNFSFYNLLTSAFMGAWTGAATVAVGGAFGGFGQKGALEVNNALFNEGLRAFAHGTFSYAASQGNTSAFYAGFFGSCAGSTFGILTTSLGMLHSTIDYKISSTVFTAGVGGISSEMTGGSFAEGAIYAGIGHVFNQLGHGRGNTKKSVVVDDNAEAVNHYYNGNGEPAEIGPNSMDQILHSKTFKSLENEIMLGRKLYKGSETLHLRSTIFHIGQTNVSYFTECFPSGNCYTKFTFFNGDGFWDPLDLDKPIKSFFGIETSDGPGWRWELGGQPYPYLQSTILMSFPNPGNYPITPFYIK